MTEQILKQEVMIDGQQVLSIGTPDIVNNHVAETMPRSAEVDPMKLQVMQNAVAKIEKAGCFDKATADRYRINILEAGDTEDPMVDRKSVV